MNGLGKSSKTAEIRFLGGGNVNQFKFLYYVKKFRIRGEQGQIIYNRC